MSEIVSRVRKLLRLAKGNGCQGEAEAALLKAQELMVLHGVTTAQIETAEDAVEDVTKGETSWCRPSAWRANLAVGLAENFRCKCYGTTRGRIASMTFLGFPEDVAVVLDLYGFVESAARRFAKGRANRGSYLLGFVHGVVDKLERQKEVKDWGLVLVCPAKVENAFADISRGFSEAADMKADFDSPDYYCGLRDGLNLELTSSLPSEVPA
jgi:hypothetical protein